jgi:hypothetical protein
MASPRLWIRVVIVTTDVSEESVTTIFRGTESASYEKRYH